MRNVLAGLMAVILCVGAMLPVQAAEPKTGDVPPALLGKDREGEGSSRLRFWRRDDDSDDKS